MIEKYKWEVKNTCQGHKVKYLGTTKEGREVLRCYSCHPSWFSSLFKQDD